MPSPSSSPTALDRLLRLFADVRAGEGVTALMLSGNIFLLLTSYYIIKSIRDGLILGEFGPEVKSYTSAGVVLVLALVVPLYGKLADAVPRRRLINITTTIFVVSFVGFYGVWLTGVNIGIAFFVWVAVFNVMIIAQFWSFANDVYSKPEGERLFPIVAFGQSLGAVVGATYVGALIGELGIGVLLLTGAGLLGVQAVVTNLVDLRERKLKEADLPVEQSSAMLTATGSIRIEDVRRMLAEHEKKQADTQRAAGTEESDGADEAEAGPSDAGSDGDSTERSAPPGVEAPAGRNAFQLVFQTRYLLMIGVLMLLLNLVNTTGEYVLDRSITDAAVAATGQTSGEEYTEYITGLKASFFSVVNIAGVLIQAFLVSRIVKYFGVATGLMILPTIALGGYALIALFPVFSVVRWAKTAENATDYSLNNTVRNMLFLPTTREQKYKAKQTIDSFFSRVGDALQAVLVLVGTTVLALGTMGFALINMSIAVVWLALAFAIGREYKRLVASGEPPA